MGGLVPDQLRDGYLSILIRFHDSRELESLDLALFSLANQGYQKVQAIICCQSFSLAELAEVQSIVDQTITPSDFEVDILNGDFGKGDHRSDLLNLGISAVRGQFLGFLDYDDVIYQGSYSYLIAQLDATPAAVAAFAGINQAIVDKAGYNYYCERKNRMLREGHKLEFFSGNQYPIHSGIINLRRVNPQLIRFDSDISRNEDYIFFMRILCTGPWCDRRKNFDIGEYMMRSDGSNTVVAGNSMDDEDKAFAWRRAYERFISERNKMVAHIEVSELVEFLSYTKRPASDYTALTSDVTQLAEALLRSKSWRYTRSFRRLSRLLTGRGYIDLSSPETAREAVKLIQTISFSKSWAISAPLRMLYSILKKLR